MSAVSNSDRGPATRRAVLLGLTAASISASLDLASAKNSSPLRQPASIVLPGVDNLFQVTGKLFRSAQPTALGFANLVSRQRVQSVVNLRAFHDDLPLVADLPLIQRRAKINTWNIGDDGGGKVARALAYLREGEKRGNVLVHCQHGADRTGAIIALYRVVYEDWDKAQAIHEMMDGPFGFHRIWANLPEWSNIPAFIQATDASALRARVAAVVARGDLHES